MKSYRIISLSLAVIFAMVGLIFLLVPNALLTLFNDISRNIGMPLSPVEGMDFYLILAVGYMYLVTVLAFLMYRYPENPIFPLLLAHGKLASAVISVYLLIQHQPYLIYITNAIVDGFIGLTVIFLFLRIKRNII